MERVIPEDAFTSVYIFATNRCNLACTYCYEKDRVGDMDRETMKNTIDWLVRQSNRSKKARPDQDISITFFGGEPLLNFPIVKYGMEYCKEIFDKTSTKFGLYILTNGTVLTEEMCDFFRQAKQWKGINFHLQVSMDGCEESHNKYRVFSGSSKGSFQLIMGNMNKLKEIFPQLIVRQTVVPDRALTLYEDFRSLVDSGGSIVNLTPIVEGDWGKENIDIYKRELERCVDFFVSHPNKSNMYFNIVNGTLLRMGDKVFNSEHGCRAGHKLLGVTFDGDIYPCHRFVAYRTEIDYKLGNVCTGGVDYNCENWKKLKDMHHSADEECKSCKVLTCNRCYATNLHLSDVSSKRPGNGYCEMNSEVTEMLKVKLSQLLVDKKIGLEKWEIVNMEDAGKIAINIGEGTEICDDIHDVMASCLVKLVRETNVIKSKLYVIEKHLGIEAAEKTEKGNIKG